MVENKITLKTVGELLGMKFIIPDYQRGYRWTKQQVNDLLNDLNEFRMKLEESKKEEQTLTKNINKNEIDDFYCLQPLVVKECIEDKQKFLDNLPKNIDDDILKITRQAIADATKWEVIDGQQRLTTIYLILFFFKNNNQIDKNLYSINYETKRGLDSFVNAVFSDIKQKDSFNEFVKKNISWNNVDFYHVFQTIRTIFEWFKDKENRFQENFAETILHKVKFIWYESVDEDPIKVFTRLNIGRISLTNAELIKALFLNRSNFNTSSIDSLKFWQQEIASEWDAIEYSLQNDEFWLFLNNAGYKRPTRIDFIFDMICEQNKLELKEDKFKLIGTDEYRTFRYFYEFFKSNQDQMHIEKCWKNVKAYYQTFREWFNDLELYHYIGFLVIHKYSLYDWMAEWTNQKRVDKKKFVYYLKKEIKEEILKQFGFNQADLKLNKFELLEQVLGFQYKEDGSDKKKCKPILLFHNIQTVVNQNKNNLDNEKYQLGVFYKFPFHLYKLENWDVEHINSNTTNEEEDTATQKEWLLNVYLSVDEEIQNKIRDYFEKTDDDQKSNLFNDIKDQFPQTEDKEWTPEEKNQIWNYTLLDSSTNRSYGNAIFSGKRRVIIGKDKGQLIPIPKITKDGKLQFTEETKAKSSFVPPCTKQVFMKYYSSTMNDANYWTKIDAEGYQKDIENCLKELED